MDHLSEEARQKFIDAGRKLLEARRSAQVPNSPTSLPSNGPTPSNSAVNESEDDAKLRLKIGVQNKRIEQLIIEKSDLVSQLEQAESSVREIAQENTTLVRQLQEEDQKYRAMKDRVSSLEEHIRVTTEQQGSSHASAIAQLEQTLSTEFLNELQTEAKMAAEKALAELKLSFATLEVSEAEKSKRIHELESQLQTERSTQNAKMDDALRNSVKALEAEHTRRFLEVETSLEQYQKRAADLEQQLNTRASDNAERRESERIAQLEQQLDRVQREKQILQTKSQLEMKQVHEAAESKAAYLQAALTRVSEEKKVVESALAEELKTHKAQAQRLAEQQRNVEAAVQGQASELAALRERGLHPQTLLRDKQSLKRVMEEKAAAMVQLKGRLSAVLNENSALFADIAALKSAVIQREERIAQLENEALQRQTDVGALRQLLEEQLSLAAQVETSAQGALRARSAAEETLSSLQQRLTEVESERDAALASVSVAPLQRSSAVAEADSLVDNPQTLEELQERRIHQLLAEIAVFESVLQQRSTDLHHLRDSAFALSTALRKAKQFAESEVQEKQALLAQWECDVAKYRLLFEALAQLRSQLVLEPSSRAVALTLASLGVGEEARLSVARLSEIAQHRDYTLQQLEQLQLLGADLPAPSAPASPGPLNSSNSNGPLPLPARRMEAKLVLYPQASPSSEANGGSRRHKGKQIVLHTNKFMSVVPLLGWWYSKSFRNAPPLTV